jgi:hypothetical protein
MDSDNEDKTSNDTDNPSVPSSSKGKKRLPQSLTPKPQAKVPHCEKGPASSGPVYRVPALGGSAILIPTLATRVILPNSMRPFGGTQGPSLAVPQQPTRVPVTGTATNPVDLDSTTLDPKHAAAGSRLLTLGTEQWVVDLNQYEWLFSPAKGEKELTIVAGLARYKAASDSFR